MALKDISLVPIRALRFGAVGTSGVAVNSGMLFALHGILHWSLPVALALASEAAILSNFVANNRWTFGQGSVSLARLARYNVAALGGLALTTALTTVVAGHGIPYLAANLAGIAAGTMSNFVTSTLWVWRTSS
jgi:dolichol-phosphate mannosyltransferase